MIFIGEKLDTDGYPTDDFLEWIKEYKFADGYSDLVDAIEEAWWTGGYGFCRKRARLGKFSLHLDTGGWSGNEEIIDALRSNHAFWGICWRVHRAGGHFDFKVRIK